MVDEYEEIQKLRQLWSRAIMTWNQIMIPLCAAIITLFVTQLPKFKEVGWGFQFLLFGWILFTALIIYWRLLVHHIDHNIVGMYPRMLELEKEKGRETQADYYFRNLNKTSKKELADKIEVEFKEIKTYKFRDFKNKVKENNNKETFMTQRDTREHENNKVFSYQKTPIDLLLEIWDELGWKSVTSRGHGIQNWTLGVLIALFLIGIFLGHYYKYY